MSEELAVILNAAQTVGASIEGPLRWLEQRLVVARGPYAPERFDDSDKVELTEVEAAWGFASSKLSQRELLYMGGIGGHPGGGWVDHIRAHDLPSVGCIYTWETDVADVGEQGTFLVATSETTDREVDARVVELALSVDDPRGLRLGLSAFGGAFDEMRAMLPRDRAVPLLIQALTEVGDVNDVLMEELAAQAPENLEPWGPEWKVWLVEEYFAPFLSDL